MATQPSLLPAALADRRADPRVAVLLAQEAHRRPAVLLEAMW